MIGATFLAVAVGFPETKWDRTHPDDLLTTTTASVPSSDKVKLEQKIELSELVEVNTPGEGIPPLAHAQTAERDPWLHKGTPSKQQFKLFQTNKGTQVYTALRWPIPQLCLDDRNVAACANCDISRSIEKYTT